MLNRYWLVFIITPIFGSVVMYFFFPETSRLSLEEIAEKFGERVVIDLTHITPEEKAALDGKIIDDNIDLVEFANTRTEMIITGSEKQ